jgi:radical SAM protein with 4Fe4S-binding SPASM domain
MYPYLRERIVLVEGPAAAGIYDLNSGSFMRVSLEAGTFLRSVNGTRHWDHLTEGEQEFLVEAMEKRIIESSSLCMERPQTQLNEVIRRLRPVRFAWLEITSKCNQLCLHCFVGDELNKYAHPPKSLLFELLRVLDEAGARQIVISGGETMLHPDFEEIIDHVGTYRFRIAVLTNGSAPHADRMIAALDHNDVTVKVPLLGWGKSHDEMSGVKPCFDRTIRFIERLVTMGVAVELGTTVTSININDISKICDYAEHLGLPLEVSPVYALGWARKNSEAVLSLPMDKIVSTCRQYSDRGKNARPKRSDNRSHQYAGDPSDYAQVNLRDYLTEHHECGQKIIAVLSSGIVTPCLLLREKKHALGSVWDNSLKQILSDDFPGRQKFDELMRLANVPGCSKCEARFVCKAGGCPASSFAITGVVNARNPLYDQCYYLNEDSRKEMGLC